MKPRPKTLRIWVRRREQTSCRRRRPRRQPQHVINLETVMSKRFALFASAAVVAFAAAVAPAPGLAQMSEKTVTVGGAPMYPSKNIIQNAVNSKDHTTLVAAVKAAGLVDTLEGAGPFTVFAPTNEAIAKLPASTVDTLLMSENKPTLTKILTYHVVAGRLGSKEIAQAIKSGHGKAEFNTVSGGKLWASMQ